MSGQIMWRIFKKMAYTSPCAGKIQPFPVIMAYLLLGFPYDYLYLALIMVDFLYLFN